MADDENPLGQSIEEIALGDGELTTDEIVNRKHLR